MKERLLQIIKEIWAYIKSLASIAEDTDSETTIANITKGVEFRSDNVWVLFFAIIIASVYLWFCQEQLDGRRLANTDR